VSARRVARPEVLRRVPLDRHVVIEASAGTGKTFTLENLVVELVLSTDMTMGDLLCVTFTEKATHEIRTRVRAKLESLLAGGGQPPTEAEIRAGDYWAIDDRARQKLAAALHGFDAATIATIHAFCHRVLRENAFASARCFEEQQIDGREAFGRALRDAFRGDVAREPVRARWLEAALNAGWSIERIEKLLWGCIQARGELRPLFDPAVLDAAIDAFPVDDAREPRLLHELKAWGTHSRVAGTITSALNDLAERVARARAARDAPLYVRDAKDVVAKLRDRLPQLQPRPGRAARVCAAALDLVRATPPFADAVAHALLGSVRAELGRSKRAAGRYDFDDMLALVDEALRGPGGRALAQVMRQRWRYALIDEFQDTDETQWSIFRRAFFDVGGVRASSVLFLVGDPKQSIYRFRGADVHTYLSARSEVTASGGASVRLDDNYRATAVLVEATNRLFEPGSAASIFTGDVAYVPVGCGRPDRSLVDGDGRAVPPVCALKFSGDLSLADLGSFIARETRVATNPERPWRFDGRPIEYRDAFVLTRSLREGRAIGAALRAAGVPHAFYKEEGLFQSDEAKDLKALLSAIDEPDDPARRMAAWLTPFFGVPLEEIERARDLPAAHPLVARLYAWKALADARDFDRLFESVVSESGVVRREIFFADGEREITNYLHLIETLVERARGKKPTLRDLVDTLSGLIEKTRFPMDLEGNMQRLASERSAVQIMTIHKSKGLEAPLVFLASGRSSPPTDDVRIYHEGGQRLAWVGSLASDVAPTVKREEAEEEQRLMYVALTRAMGRVYLPYLVDSAGKSKGLRGPYERVNRRVAELVSAGDPLVGLEEVERGVGLRGKPPSATAAEWRPPAALLRDRDVRTAYASLRERHAAAVVTSYTRMRGGRDGARSVWIERPEDRRAQKSGDAFDDAPPTTLRAARASGVFLHEMLERIPLGSFLLPGGFPGWRAREDVSSLFQEGIAAHRIDPGQREHAERLVWAAYTTPLVLPGGDELLGFAAAERMVREMEFVYPIPEPEHPKLADPKPPQALRVARGYVRGSLDLAFEHRGLTYFADWKSDSLASYGPDALHRHVVLHYEEQAKLYALAVVRLLGVRSQAEYEARFGGLLYCFLRGFDEKGGLWSARPSWDDLLAWDDSLRARRDWGAGAAS
jgi:exodeoxyribonuclease V beta subunit